ncbi:MAG: DMT family transporter [Pseudomonadota bacterium]
MAARVAALTVLAMVAFAANSLLARLAIRDGLIDASSFTVIRLVSGALALWLLVRVRDGARGDTGGTLAGAAALFVYAAAFSFAYLDLSAAMGALILFGAVQVTMISVGLARGDRLSGRQWLGLAVALVGLVGLLSPGLSAPPVGAAALMLVSGVAWGVYSLLGRGVHDPLAATAGNFVRAAPASLGLLLVSASTLHGSGLGVAYAVASGVVASGVGYAIWYSALPALSAPVAGSVQLSVPVIAAAGGVLFLAEPVSFRLAFGGLAVLGGVAVVIVAPVLSQRRRDRQGASQ